MRITEVTKEGECCCSCEHNIRVTGKDGFVTCHCELDNHYIGYMASFDNVCKEWVRDKKWEGKE